MTIARVAIEVPPGMSMLEFEVELAKLATRLGTNLQRSPDMRMPSFYEMWQRYPQQKATK